MRIEVAPYERGLFIGGLILSLGALGLVFMDARGALTGWLAAAAIFNAIPAGALCLQAMMRLIPGVWGEQMRLSCEAGTLLGVPVLVAFVPVLAGWAAIYTDQATTSAFQHAWLLPIVAIPRTLLWFGLLIVGGRWLRRRWYVVPVSIVVLILFAMLGSYVAIDWLMALNRGFASSSFGLTVLVQWTGIAFAALLLLRLSLGRAPRRMGVLGSLMLTLLLLWAYLQFLGFFINWSPGLPEGAAWYRERTGGAWTLVILAFGLLGGVPLLALILSGVRRNPLWLKRLSIAVLLGKGLEFAWLALPGRGGVSIAAFLLSVTGLSLIVIAALPVALRSRIARRTA